MFDLPTILAGAGWDLGTFLTSAKTTISNWFSLAIALLGIVAIGYSVWQIVTGLMSHGKKQVNWAISIILLLVGGALATSGGWQLVQDISGGGTKTIKDLGGGTIVLIQYSRPFLPW